MIKHNGKNTVLIAGYFKENRNIVTIGEEVRVQLDDLKNNYLIIYFSKKLYFNQKQ